MYTNSGFPSQHLEHNNIEIQCSAQAVAVNKHTSIIGKKGDIFNYTWRTNEVFLRHKSTKH